MYKKAIKKIQEIYKKKYKRTLSVKIIIISLQ